MESLNALDYSKFEKIVNSGEENVAKEVIKAIESFIVPAEYEKEVMFNTIEVLAKKLDNIGVFYFFYFSRFLEISYFFLSFFALFLILIKNKKEK